MEQEGAGGFGLRGERRLQEGGGETWEVYGALLRREVGS